MTGRRKGTPCACNTDPCSCGSSGRNCIRAINNLSPDANGDFVIEAGSGILITQTSDNGFEVSFDGTLPSNPLIYKGTVGSGGTVAVLPAADPDNIGWTFIAIEAATSPVTYEVGDVLISDGYTWQVVPSGDEIVPIVTAWQATPDDQHVPSEKLVKDSLDGKLDKRTNVGQAVYAHNGPAQMQIAAVSAASSGTIVVRDADARAYGDDPADNTDLLCLVNVNTLNGRLTDGSVTKIGTVNVGSDTKPIKLVNGVPAAVTNDLVDLPSAQAITGVKTVPLEATGTFSNQIASSNKVKNELDNYTPMVRTTGNVNIAGRKIFENGFFGKNVLFNVAASGNHYLHIAFTAVTTQIVKARLIEFINNAASCYFDIIMSWNGSNSAKRVYVRRLGPSNILLSNFQMAYDGTIMHLFVKLVNYATVYADIENAFSWINDLTVTIEHLTDPDLSGYTLENVIEI